MKTFSPLLFASMLLGAVSAPAFADCSSDLSTLEPKVSEVGNAAKKEKAQRSITLALEHSQSGDEKGCQKLLGEARKVAGIKK